MIRHRLVVAVVATIAAVMAVTGVVVVSVLERRLVAAVDEQLTAALPRVPDVQQGDHLTARLGDNAPPHAVIHVGPDRTIRAQIPSGPASDPDPLPDIAGLTATGTPVTVPAIGEDGPTYRAIGVATPDGGMLVAAVPLTDVAATIAETRRILLAAGALALVIAAAIVWLSIRRGLRPIDNMIVAAERIAAGDLTARATAPQPGTEVGHLSAALNTMLDRIEQAMATKAESEARMRRFVADASHELRTPLTSIRGYAELYRRGATSPEEVARGMARIERQAQHMADLVEGLLVLARLDQGRPLADEPANLNTIVEEAVADARAADPHRPIVVDLPAQPAIVRGDRRRLRQVLDNLLATVRDHTKPGTVATITLVDHGGAAVLTVADNGPGMRAEEAARAFERFWQGEVATTRDGQGTGLGLAIAAELVAAHHGTITLDTAPGRGTSFTITLTVAAQERHGA